MASSKNSNKLTPKQYEYLKACAESDTITNNTLDSRVLNRLQYADYIHCWHMENDGRRIIRYYSITADGLAAIAAYEKS